MLEKWIGPSQYDGSVLVGTLKNGRRGSMYTAGSDCWIPILSGSVGKLVWDVTRICEVC